MRRSNFALRLQPSLLEELRKAAESEGVALNQLINVAVAEKFLPCVPRSIFGKGVAVAIAPKPCGFSTALEKGIPLWKATNFHRSGRRSQAGKWQMGDIRPVSVRKRKGPLLSSVSVPDRISAPVSTRLHVEAEWGGQLDPNPELSDRSLAQRLSIRGPVQDFFDHALYFFIGEFRIHGKR
jgi:hypothetical protein